jgi:GTPase SAR1 family protein
MQLEGMFDLPIAKASEQKWTVHLNLPEEWSIGLIVGPSGSGKSTIARELFGKHFVKGYKWAKDKSIIDCFPISAGIKDITGLLSSVGFSTPPSWLRPFHVLSNGEQFRVTIARALAEQKDLLVIDEFTSVVDRTVAKIGSAAVAKTVRRRGQKMIAVSCHYDIKQWLAPDWVYEPATDTLSAGRSLRRPSIKLSIFRVHHKAWELFRHHHYLDTVLHKSAACFLATWNEVPVAFSSWLPLFSRIPAYREHRTVCLPDFQGVGIGNAVSAYCASIFAGMGKRVFSTTSHPSMITARAKNKATWRLSRAPSLTGKDGGGGTSKHATRRFTASFEYVGPSMDRREAALF